MKVCVYTILTGDYEELNVQPMAAKSTVPFICITDSVDRDPKGWKVERATKLFDMDLVRSQRVIKCDAREWIGDYDVSLYIDNTVILQETPEEIIKKYLDDSTNAVYFLHSFRETVFDEFEAVLSSGLDEPARVIEQLGHYELSNQDVFEERPIWTGILIRRHNDPSVVRAMNVWRSHILRYSRRDQLSLNYVLSRDPEGVKRIDLDNRESWFHRWPVHTKRVVSRRHSSPRASLPARHNIAMLESENKRLRQALQERSLRSMAKRFVRSVTKKK